MSEEKIRKKKWKSNRKETREDAQGRDNRIIETLKGGLDIVYCVGMVQKNRLSQRKK